MGNQGAVLDTVLRPARHGDSEFLFQLYAGSRRDEVASFGWSTEQTGAFLRMQFDARERAYRIQFPYAVFLIIESAGTPLGRLIKTSTAEEIVVVDIAIREDQRSRGIGGHVIRLLQADAAEAGLPLVLRVDKANTRAFYFYERLGFKLQAESQIAYSMVWKHARRYPEL